MTWQEIHDALLDQIALARESADRWSLAATDKPAGRGDVPDPLQELAWETLQAAYNNIALIVTEISYKTFILPRVSTRVGTVADLPKNYGRELLKTGSFADPLRRYADAVARTRGMRCNDYLTGLRDSRDVFWIQVRGGFNASSSRS